jgi:Purine-nucleoside phosphorylase
MTPHNLAEKGEIARVVLAPGDPERCEFIASNFLSSSSLVSKKRGNVVITGTYKGMEVSLCSTGMGAAGAGIYTYELYKFYDVESIIRIGTAGGLKAEIEPGELVVPLSVSTDGAYASQYRLHGTLSPCPDYSLFKTAIDTAGRIGQKFHSGMVFSSEYFSEYNATGEESLKEWVGLGALAQDMETYALFSNALYLGKKALSILTVTDNCISGRSVKDEERMTCLEPMIKLALETAVESLK